MAGNGDDFISFQGEIGQLTLTLINPYSNEMLDIDDEYNVNISSYDGLGGNDLLNFTNFGDAIFIRDVNHHQVVSHIETFLAGDGGDIIALADPTIILGDVKIFGGEGDDILWSNAGNDEIAGAGGNDIIDGGPGNDKLFGENDNDSLNGGEGDDYINGGNGDDILYGGNRVAPVVLDKDFNDVVVFPHLLEGVNIINLVPPGTPALGVAAGNLHADYQAQATLTFREGFAGYNNTLGTYSVDSDGTMHAGSILWENTKTAGIDTPHVINLPLGANGGNFGFFIIADGDRVNDYTGLLHLNDPGNIHFVYDLGLGTERDAKITDDGTHVSIVYDDGVTHQVLNGPDYFTTERGGSTLINEDHQEHVVSGLVDIGQHDVLRIGFEDLPNLGDADYEDVLFDVNLNEVITDGQSEAGKDTLIGGAGNDTLYGQDGDDILVVGEGRDEIYGGRGNDQIIFDHLDNLADNIHGFEMGVDHDVINITDILSGYDPVGSAIADFVQVTALNGDTHIQVNADGDHGGTFTEIAVIAGVETTLADLINNGNLVANQHVNV